MAVKTDTGSTGGDVWEPSYVGPSTTGGAGTGGTMSASPLYPGSELWNEKVWSWHPATPGASGSHGTAQDYKTESNLSYGELIQLISKVYTKNEIAAFQRQIAAANLTSIGTMAWGTPDESTMNAFGEIFAATIRWNQGKPPAQRLTWQEMLAQAARAGRAGDAAASGGSGGGPQTYTQTSTSLTGAGQAGQYLESAMADLLGRAPTDQEVSAFRTRLNAAERADPTTTTTTTDGHGNTTSSTQQSDVDPYTESKDFATGGPRSTEAGAYGIQQYASALEQLFGGG